jgi:hypothetical protein
MSPSRQVTFYFATACAFTTYQVSPRLIQTVISDTDIAGFGDTNQLREAHINRYRWMADLELIVAGSSRIRTSKTLNKQIARSIHIKGGVGRTILVMNKTDVSH